MHPLAPAFPFLIIFAGLIANFIFGRSVNTRLKVASMSADDLRRAWESNHTLNGAACMLFCVVSFIIIDEKHWHQGLPILGLVIYVFAAILGCFTGKVYAIRRW